MERIHSLAKEKETFLKDSYQEKGISASLVDVKFNLNPADDAGQQWKKFRSAIKRHKKASFLESSLEEKIQFTKDISFGPYQLWIQRLGLQTPFDQYMCELLWVCAKFYKNPALKKAMKENPLSLVEKTIPVKVELKWGAKEFVGYSLLQQEIPQGTHFKKWNLKRRGFGYEIIFDLPSLLTDILANNTLVQFTKTNMDLVQYKIAQEFSDISKREGRDVVPTDEQFAKDLKDVMDRFQLPYGFGNPITDAAITIYAKDFYATEDESGNIPSLRSGYLRKIMVQECLSTMAYIKDKTERFFEQKSEYARSFQTKKNIPQKVQAVMKNNVFLQRYAYVELDESVDLEKFAKLEKEFVQLMSAIHVPVAKDHSFRVKRLGHYRAAGVYFPSYKATIFSVDAPWALIHEMGHQIDFSVGRKEGLHLLSEAIRFKPVYDLYKRKVIDLVQEDPAYLAVWRGKTKYNASYYLQNTEVFARCYEIYLYFVKGIRSSFLEENYTSPVYPRDDEFIETVRSYFDHLFDLLGWKKEAIQEKESEKANQIEEAIAVEWVAGRRAAIAPPSKTVEDEWIISCVETASKQLAFDF